MRGDYCRLVRVTPHWKIEEHYIEGASRSYFNLYRMKRFLFWSWWQWDSWSIYIELLEDKAIGHASPDWVSDMTKRDQGGLWP